MAAVGDGEELETFIGQLHASAVRGVESPRRSFLMELAAWRQNAWPHDQASVGRYTVDVYIYACLPLDHGRGISH